MSVAAGFAQTIEAALRDNTPDAIDDDAFRRAMTAMIRLYAAKAEDAGAELPPFAPDAVTTTEAVVLACAIIRAAGLNLFDVAMWFGRPSAGL